MLTRRNYGTNLHENKSYPFFEMRKCVNLFFYFIFEEAEDIVAQRHPIKTHNDVLDRPNIGTRNMI